MHTGWFTQTKFIPPRLREDFVPRIRLLEALHEESRSRPLVLLSAPPGYGKTTLLASFPIIFRDLPTAWVSIDEDDNDPARFLNALVFALQHQFPGFGRNIQKLLENLPDPAAEARRVVSSLINGVLVELPETWLILDDLHMVTEPVIYTSLDYLLERLPPQLHILVATRRDPPLSLARLRARGQLAELRVADLRFTAEEVCQFLNEKQHLHLSQEDLIQLQYRAEGWVAGLRLLAASLDQISSASGRSAFISDLAGTNRYIFEFLAEEVLKRQEQEVRAFLLHTSILPELTPWLCNALTGRNDSLVLLERLYRHNLFLTQTGETTTGFCYHSLFAEFLRQHLKQEDPVRFAELHLRAAEAQRTSAPSRTIAHYLAAESWENAARTIEETSEEFLQQGYLQSLRNWIDALPRVVRDAHPRLLYLLGWCHTQRGELQKGAEHLEAARLGFQAIGDRDEEGKTLLLLIDIASRGHDFARQARLTQQAQEFPLPVFGQVQLQMAQVWQLLYQGNARQADAALEDVLQLTLTSNELRSFHVVAPLLNMQLAFLPGGISRLEHYCHQVLSCFGDGIGLVQACAHALLGYIRFLHGSLRAASDEVEQAQEIFSQIGGLAYTGGQMLYTLGVISALQGDIGKTEELWVGALPQIEETPMLRPYAVAVRYFIGRSQWMQQKIEEARQTEVQIAATVDTEEYPEILVARILMRAFIEIGDSKFSEAETTLQQATFIEQRWRHAGMFGSGRVLLAYLHLRRKREKEAWALFAPFLSECVQRATPGLILQETVIAVPLLQLALQRNVHMEFVQGILEILVAAHSREPVPIASTGQTLTRREVEVLELIVDGLSNQEIAVRLFISKHTVKVHITNLFAKLNVTSRTQAAARAREIGLIEHSK